MLKNIGQIEIKAGIEQKRISRKSSTNDNNTKSIVDTDCDINALGIYMYMCVCYSRTAKTWTNDYTAFKNNVLEYLQILKIKIATKFHVNRDYLFQWGPYFIFYEALNINVNHIISRTNCSLHELSFQSIRKCEWQNWWYIVTWNYDIFFSVYSCSLETSMA